MKTTLKIAAAIAALGALSACHTMPPCHDDLAAQAPDPMKPKVSLVAGEYLVVNQEPLVFTPRQVNVPITWHLPATGGYRFPQDGITFSDDRDGKQRTGLRQTADEQIIKCGASEDGLTFTCLNRHTKPGTYKYTITIESKDGRKLTLDPRVNNY